MTWKAKPKGSNGWQNFENCTIGISLGNPNCQGEKLEAMVNWLNEQPNFKRVLIDLSDTLNRYNLMLEDGLNEEDARKKASAAGDAWLAANQHILDTIKAEWQVFRWEHWMNKPEIKEYRQQFDAAFRKDEAFRIAVLHDVETYNNRHGREAWELDRIGKMQYNIGYLLEELAVHSFIYHYGPVASLYPGKQQESFKMVREGLVANVPNYLTNSHFVTMNVYDDTFGRQPSNVNGKGKSDGNDQDGNEPPYNGGSQNGGKSISSQIAFGASASASIMGPTSAQPRIKPSRGAAVRPGKVARIANDVAAGYALLFGTGPGFA